MTKHIPRAVTRFVRRAKGNYHHRIPRIPALRLGMLGNPNIYSFKEGEVGNNAPRRPRWKAQFRSDDYNYTSERFNKDCEEFYNAVCAIRRLKPNVVHLPLYRPYKHLSDYEFMYQSRPTRVRLSTPSSWGAFNSNATTTYRTLQSLNYTPTTARALYNDWNALWNFLTNPNNIQTHGVFSTLHALRPQVRAVMMLGNYEGRFSFPGLPYTVDGQVYKGFRALIDWFRTYTGNSPETDMPTDLRHLCMHNLGLYMTVRETWGSDEWYARGTFVSPAAAHPNAITVGGEPLRLPLVYVNLPINPNQRDTNNDFVPDINTPITVVLVDYRPEANDRSTVVRPCGIPMQRADGESNLRALFDPRTPDPIGQTAVRLFAERLVEFYTDRVARDITIDGTLYQPERDYPALFGGTEIRSYSIDLYGDYTYPPDKPEQMPWRVCDIMFDNHGNISHGYPCGRLPRYNNRTQDPYRTFSADQLRTHSRLFQRAIWYMDMGRAYRALRQALLAINPHYTPENFPFEINAFDIPELNHFNWSVGYNPSTHGLPANIQTGALSSDATIETALNRLEQLFDNATNITAYGNAMTALLQWSALFLFSQIQSFLIELHANQFTNELDTRGYGDGLSDNPRPPSDNEVFRMYQHLLTNPSYTPAFLTDFFTDNLVGRRMRLILSLGKGVCYYAPKNDPRSNRIPYRMRRAFLVRLAMFMANLPDGIVINSQSLPGIHSVFHSVFPLTVTTTGWSKRFILSEGTGNLRRVRNHTNTSLSGTVASALYHTTNRYEPFVLNTPLAHEPLPSELIETSANTANPPTSQENENPEDPW